MDSSIISFLYAPFFFVHVETMSLLAAVHIQHVAAYIGHVMFRCVRAPATCTTYTVTHFSSLLCFIWRAFAVARLLNEQALSL